MRATRRGPAGLADPLARGLRQRVEDRVQQVAAAPPVQRADRLGLAQAERPQGRSGRFRDGVVHLVCRNDNRLPGPPEHGGDGVVGVGDPDHGVEHEQHRVGGLHGHPGLRGDLFRQLAALLALLGARERLPAAGVHHRERAAPPGGVVGDPVPGHPGHVLDHGLPAAQDAVDQGGLADVGPADDRQHRDTDVGPAVAAVRGIAAPRPSSRPPS